MEIMIIVAALDLILIMFYLSLGIGAIASGFQTGLSIVGACVSDGLEMGIVGGTNELFYEICWGRFNDFDIFLYHCGIMEFPNKARIS